MKKMNIEKAIRFIYLLKETKGGNILGKDADKQEIMLTLDFIIKSLTDLRKYQELGTIEELYQEALQKKAYEDQIRFERDVAVAQLNEIGIDLGEKMDSVKKTIDKCEELIIKEKL